MYKSRTHTLDQGNALKYRLFHGEELLPFGTFLEDLQRSREFREFFMELLREVPFRAYHWETPPVTAATARQPFEFVVTRTPGIDLAPDPGPFEEYFEDLDETEKVAVFDNLGGDARLLAPAPPGMEDGDQSRQGQAGAELPNYSHIGVFTAGAPPALQHAFWRAGGRQVLDLLSDEPLWLNTAGGGVAWLHARIDTRPKYYRHLPYTEVPG